MAKCWCHRLDFFYSIWYEAGEGSYHYTSEELAAYKHPVELDTYISSAAASSKSVQEAIAELFSMFPQNP